MLLSKPVFASETFGSHCFQGNEIAPVIPWYIDHGPIFVWQFTSSENRERTSALVTGSYQWQKTEVYFRLSATTVLSTTPPSRELFTNSERQLPYKYGVLSNLEWKESSWSWQSEQLPLGVSSPCRVLHPTTRLEQSAIGTLFSILFCARYWQSSATHWPPLNWFSWKTCKTILHLEILNGLETTWKPCQINWLTLQ